ncbi:SPOR domain-containing protein [Canibacter zhuwentaonis]|uniref:SPOR domain-containing protein n=1 Tax=Canibacter zhuwentaonis TaxID=2837491 RepID=UPI0032B5F896
MKSEITDTEPEKYWYNTKTREVEKGKQAMAIYRLGPFESAAAAAQAPEILQARSAQWQAEEDAADE